MRWQSDIPVTSPGGCSGIPLIDMRDRHSADHRTGGYATDRSQRRFFLMAAKQSRFTLRIHPIVMEKMRFIANYNGRSVNKEIEQILKWVIEDFENNRGRIKLEEPEHNDTPIPPALKRKLEEAQKKQEGSLDLFTLK